MALSKPDRKEADDIVKNVRKLKPNKFSGKQCDWDTWRSIFEMTLNSVDEELAERLESPLYNGSHERLMNYERHVASAMVVYLMSCLPEECRTLVLGVKPWSYAQAGVGLESAYRVIMNGSGQVPSVPCVSVTAPAAVSTTTAPSAPPPETFASVTAKSNKPLKMTTRSMTKSRDDDHSSVKDESKDGSVTAQSKPSAGGVCDTTCEKSTLTPKRTDTRLSHAHDSDYQIPKHCDDQLIMKNPHPSSIWSLLLKRYEPKTAMHACNVLSELNQMCIDDFGGDFLKYSSKMNQLIARVRRLDCQLDDKACVQYLLAGLGSSTTSELIGTLLDLDNRADALTYSDAVEFLSSFYARDSIRRRGNAARGSNRGGARDSSVRTSAVALSASADQEQAGGSSVSASTIMAATARNGSRPECTYCHKPGHTADDCWTLHPEKRDKSKKARSGRGNWQRRREFKEQADSSNGKSGNSSYCAYCGDTDHVQEKCPIRSRAQRVRKLIEEGKSVKLIEEGKSVVDTHQASSVNELNDGVTIDGFHVINADAWPAITTSNSSSSSSACDIDRSLFVADSGAMYHICNNINLFTDFIELKKPILMNTFIKGAPAGTARHIGKVKFTALITGQQRTRTLTDVVYIPTARANLLSMPALMLDGIDTMFVAPRVGVPAYWRAYHNGDESNVFIEGPLTNRKCVVNVTASDVNDDYMCAATQADDEIETVKTTSAHVSILTLHRRMGHIRKNALLKLLDDMKITYNVKHVIDELNKCSECVFAKLAKRPFPNEANERAKASLERVHTDICGPMPTPTPSGYKYFVTFVDDHSRYVVAEPLRLKSEFVDKLRDYSTYWPKSLEKSIKSLRSDNSGENTSAEVDSICIDNGIKRELTVPYNPQQNGVAERMNRTLMECVRALLFTSGMPDEYWRFALAFACDVHNNIPSRVINMVTPASLWSDKYKLNVADFRVFGCRALARVPKEKLNKLQRRAVDCVYIGRNPNGAGHQLLHVEQPQIIIARDVAFFENEFPFKKQQLASSRDYGGVESDDELMLQSTDPASPDDIRVSRTHDDTSQSSASGPSTDQSVARAHSDVNAQQTRHSTRMNLGVPPARYGDLIDHDDADIEHAALATDLTALDEPRSYAEAMRAIDVDKWKEAAKREYDSLIENGTWTLVELPKDRKPIKCKWIFKIKKNDGVIEKYKARLVAKGFSQIPGVDYDETFAPVPQPKTVRIILALAAQLGMKAKQYDVETAFLNGKLDQEIYMEQPEGFVKGANLVCKLQKSLYGLKQSPRIWNEDLTRTMSAAGYKQCRSDACVFVRQYGDHRAFVLVWVDDIAIISDDDALIVDTEHKLSARYKLKKLGDINWLLRMRIVHDLNSHNTRITQHEYVNQLFTQFNMNEANAMSTPAQSNEHLTSDMCPSTDDEKIKMTSVPYKSLTGSLLYAVNWTRPDIAFATGEVCRFNQNPGMKHWIAAKRIVRYLRGTASHGLTYKPTEHGTQIYGYVDASWASDPMTRKSTSGYTFYLAGGPISWMSKRQPVVALSSAEAEYVAISSATQEALWLRSMMEELGYPQSPTIIYSDSTTAIAIANNPVLHSRVKHIDIRHHFVRDCIQRNQIKFIHQHTTKMIADILTKPLGATLFNDHMNNLIHST